MKRMAVGLIVGFLLGSATVGIAACGGWKITIEDSVYIYRDGRSSMVTVSCSAWIWDEYLATSKSCEAY